MSWKLRHEGSPRSIENLTPTLIVQGLQDGQWEPTDEVMGPNDKTWVPIETHPQFEEIIEDLEPPPPRHQEDETTLDMTPLIDVTQVLLIFFILTTSYASLQKVIEAAGATAQAAGPAVVTKEQVQETMIKVNVTQEGDHSVIRVENEVVPIENLVPALNRFKNAAARRKLLLENDPQVPHGVIVTIQDAAKSAGMEGVLFLVPPNEIPGK